MLIYPRTANGKFLGLLMAPNWMGVTEAATALVRRQAEKGYVVLRVDLYGKTVRPANPE